MKLRRLARFLMLLVILLLIPGGFAIYFLQDEAFIKKQLQSQLLQRLGWQLEIDGELKVNWASQTVIEATALRLTNPQSNEHSELFSAAGLRLTLQPLQLLQRKLVLDELQLDDCQLDYRENEAGESNWSQSDHQPKPDRERKESLSWSIEKLAIANCSIVLLRREQAQPLNIQLDQGQLQIDAASTLEAHIKGKLDQQELSLDGTVSPWSALWQGGRLEHKILLQAGQIKLQSEGSVEDLHRGDGANLNLHFSGPEFGQITDLMALPELSSGAFDARMNIQQTSPDGQMDLRIVADLGSLEIDGAGQLDRLIDPQSGTLDLHAQGPDLAALGQTFGQQWILAKPFELKVDAAIQNSQTQLKTFTLQTGTDSLKASGQLGPWPGLLGSQLKIEIHSPDLQPWLQSIDQKPLPIRRVDLAVNLQHQLAGQFDLDASGILGSISGADQDIELQTSLTRQQQRLTVQDMKLQLGRDQLNLSGQLHLVPTLTDSEFTMRTLLADAQATGQWLGLDDWPNQPLELAARLSRSGEALKFDVSDSKLADLSFSLSGQMPDVRQPRALSTKFKVNLSSLSAAEQIVSMTGLPGLPFSATGEVHLDGKHGSRWRGVELALGQSSAQLDADLLLKKGLPGSSVRWSAQGKDLRELWRDMPAGLEFGPFTLSGVWQRQSAGDRFEGLQFRSDLVTLTASGSVEDWSKTGKFQLEVDAQSANTSGFQHWLGPWFDDQPLTLKFASGGNLAQFRVRDIRVSQGQSDVSGDLEFDLRERPAISGELRSELLDLGPWEQQLTELKPGRKLQLEEAAGTQRKRLFSEQAIPSLGEIPVDLALQIEAQKLLYTNGHMQELKLSVDVQPQLLQLHNFTFKSKNGGYYVGQVTGRQSGANTELALKAQIENLTLGQFGRDGQNPDSLPLSDVKLDLRGKGQFWNTLAQSLTGQVRWYSGKGQVSNSGMNFIFSDLLTQIFNTLNPLKTKSQFTDLQCSVYAADFMGGKMKLSPIVIQTDQISAFSEGEIDLATEQINLNFRTVPRKGLGISAASVVNPFFRIGGTLMNPSLQLDVTRGAISGGALVATAGLSVLFKSLSDRLLTSKDPCGDARSIIESNDRKLGVTHNQG